MWCNAYTEKVKGAEHCVYRSGDGDDTIIRNADNVKSDNLTIAQMIKNMKLKGFRLPTEAEWEFAARYEKGKTDNIDDTAVKYGNGLYLTKLTYASGATADYSDATATSLVAWFEGTTSGNSEGHTHEVGTKAANKLGLFDMSGNVSEMCFDGYNTANSDGDYTIGGVVLNPLGFNTTRRSLTASFVVAVGIPPRLRTAPWGGGVVFS